MNFPVPNWVIDRIDVMRSRSPLEKDDDKKCVFVHLFNQSPPVQLVKEEFLIAGRMILAELEKVGKRWGI